MQTATVHDLHDLYDIHDLSSEMSAIARSSEMSAIARSYLLTVLAHVTYLEMDGHRSSMASSPIMRTPLPERPLLASTPRRSPVASPIERRSAAASPAARTQALPPRVSPVVRREAERSPAIVTRRVSTVRSAPATALERRDDQAARRYRTTMYTQPSPEEITVHTVNGAFRIPNFDLMDEIEIKRCLNSYETKFRQMNKDWEHLGVVIEMPRSDEDISNIAVRYMETEKHLSTRTGGDFWFIGLCIAWGFIQYTACEYDLPAEGYVESQIAMYKIYQSQLIRMGATSGFGTEWSPWMQVTITSCANLVLLIVLSKIPGAKDSAPMLMREISHAITGNNEVEKSSEGTPKPNAGGLQNMITSVIGGGSGASVDGFMGLITGFLGGGGGGSKKKRSKKQKKKDVEARRSNDDDLDL